MSKELIGSNREIVGSPAYFEMLHNAHFSGTLRCSWGDDFARSMESLAENRYCHLFQPNLEGIVREIEQDLEQGLRDNDYIRDENADNLRAALKQLERCGVQCYSLERMVDDLAWFVGGDADKIRQLQQKLNDLGICDRLEEDGVFGKKTLAAWNKFKEVLSGSVPALGFIDPLQPEYTGYSHKVVTKNLPKGKEYSIILDKNHSPKGTRAFMLDKPHGVKGKPVGYHMNVEFDVPKKFQKFFYDHKEISESTYLKLKNFRNVAKPVRIAGKVLLAAGIALDTIELGTAIYEDVKDADHFPEKSTVTTAVEIGSRWTGSILGAQKGAAVGAVIGSAFPVVGTAVGGAVGGVLGGIGGSYVGGWIGECLVDITWLEQ